MHDAMLALFGRGRFVEMIDATDQFIVQKVQLDRAAILLVVIAHAGQFLGGLHFDGKRLHSSRLTEHGFDFLDGKTFAALFRLFVEAIHGVNITVRQARSTGREAEDQGKGKRSGGHGTHVASQCANATADSQAEFVKLFTSSEITLEKQALRP